MSEIRTVGILTSGGDAPGMNAAIRAVTRASIARGYKVMGIRKGYQGLIDGDMFEMGARDVSDIVQRGGTMLYTARSKKFTTEEGILLAKKNCDEAGIDSLVCIGGDGTFRGLWIYPSTALNVFAFPAPLIMILPAPTTQSVLILHLTQPLK